MFTVQKVYVGEQLRSAATSSQLEKQLYQLEKQERRLSTNTTQPSPEQKESLANLSEKIAKIKEQLHQVRALEVIKSDATFPTAIVLYTVSALVFVALFVGVSLGWRHLSWLRGQSPEKPALLSGMIAALLWPLIITSIIVFLIVAIPINMRGWIYLSFIIGLIFVLCFSAWVVLRTLAWTKNQPYPFSQNS